MISGMVLANVTRRLGDGAVRGGGGTGGDADDLLMEGRKVRCGKRGKGGGSGGRPLDAARDVTATFARIDVVLIAAGPSKNSPSFFLLLQM